MSAPGAYHPDYGRLTAYLQACEEQQLTLAIVQLEQDILLGPLPLGARRQHSWWSNSPSRLLPQNRSWLDVGWRVASVDRIEETVTFERAAPAAES